MVKKIAFWVRLAGWSGLVSGSSVLMLYQYSHSSLFLINLITIVLFSAMLTPRNLFSKFYNIVIKQVNIFTIS